jgi:hypothetical protein
MTGRANSSAGELQHHPDGSSKMIIKQDDKIFSDSRNLSV